MIIVRFNGGIGNQMFQYALAKRLALKFGVDIYADLQDYKTNHGHPFGLELFGFNLPSSNKKDLALFDSFNNNNIAFRIKRLFLKPVLIKEQKFTYDSQVLEKASKYSYLDGYWQSEKYFIEVRKDLIKDFEFIHEPSSETKNILEVIKNTNSVAVHFRRGDYVTNPSTLKFHGICSRDYYHRSFVHMNKSIEKPNYFVFSDDIEWVKNNLNISGNINYIEHTNVQSSWEDLLMMKNCKHNIIANSTFSWWGAWLGDQDGRIVIAPNKWFANKEIDDSDIVPDRWLRFE